MHIMRPSRVRPRRRTLPIKPPACPMTGSKSIGTKRQTDRPTCCWWLKSWLLHRMLPAAFFDIRFVDQNFGGYGSELRSDVRIGYLTQAGTEYYRPLGASRFFIQPSVQILREPVYLWEDQKRVSERFLQHAGGGFDFGLAVSQNLQASLEYRASTIRWKLVLGTDSSPTPQLSGRVESAAAHFVYTTRTAAIASPHGTQVDFTVGHLFDTSASTDAPFPN